MSLPQSVFSKNPNIKNTTAFTHRLTRRILIAALVLLLASFTTLAATMHDSRSRLAPPTGTCNLPPIPAPGQGVTWTLAESPYEICQNITIPATSMVIVEAGVHINFDADMQVIVLGTMQLQGQTAQHIVLQAPAVFPLLIDIDGGVFNAAFSDFTGRVRVENGANVALSDCRRRRTLGWQFRRRSHQQLQSDHSRLYRDTDASRRHTTSV